jgi:hypothetical protein
MADAEASGFGGDPANARRDLPATYTRVNQQVRQRAQDMSESKNLSALKQLT